MMMTEAGAIYLGTEQFITLVVVLGVLGAILVFLAKHQFNQIINGQAESNKKLEKVQTELQADIKENHDRLDKRIDQVEKDKNREIAELKQNVNDIKGDFATTFVLREDFFRYMNSMEKSVKDTNRKVDRILEMMTNRRNGNGTE